MKAKYPKVLADLVIGFVPVPRDFKEVLRDLGEATWDLVSDLTSPEFRDLAGEQKAERVVSEIAEWATKAFEDVPLWRQMDDTRQKRLISGLAEWAYFAIDAHHKSLRPRRSKVKRPRARRSNA